ncbi:MAG: hypothetical protein V1859_07325 [archaeon]
MPLETIIDLLSDAAAHTICTISAYYFIDMIYSYVDARMLLLLEKKEQAEASPVHLFFNKIYESIKKNYIKYSVAILGFASDIDKLYNGNNSLYKHRGITHDWILACAIGFLVGGALFSINYRINEVNRSQKGYIDEFKKGGAIGAAIAVTHPFVDNLPDPTTKFCVVLGAAIACYDIYLLKKK